jgi:hypothetical protein
MVVASLDQRRAGTGKILRTIVWAEMPGFFLGNLTGRGLRTVAGDGRTPP